MIERLLNEIEKERAQVIEDIVNLERKITAKKAYLDGLEFAIRASQQEEAGDESRT